MGVENSNQMQYGVNEAMGELVALKPKLTQAERNKWRTLGTQTILDEITRLTDEKAAKVVAVTPAVVDPVAEEVTAKGKKNA